VSSPASSHSALVQTLLARANAAAGAAPEDVICELIRDDLRRQRRTNSAEARIQCLLRRRKVNSVEEVADLSYDGLLQPAGDTFADGFKVLLKKDGPATRLRFTLAHEIGHTYFYELAPEIKFAPHDIDPTEERLCDLAAAEILMPARDTRRAARGMPVCLETLGALAEQSSVSIAAMFLRLRSLRLWKCQLLQWYRMLNGTFVLERVYGGKALPWKWHDDSILSAAWQRNKPKSGEAYVAFEDEQRVQYWKAVLYDVGRRRDRVIALWGSDVHIAGNYPLFRPTAG
jgi:hypothetical protein